MLLRAKTQRDLHYDHKTLLNTYYVLGEVHESSHFSVFESLQEKQGLVAHTCNQGFGRQRQGDCWEFEAWATV